ncbi:hypothetical protein [Streptomyces sp. YIM S03343]
MSEDTGAMWAVLLMLAVAPAMGYALVTRLTGRGRKGAASWQPIDDPVFWAGAGAAVAGHALAAVAVVGDWGGMSGPLSAAYAGGGVASALVYAYDAWTGNGRAGDGDRGEGTARAGRRGGRVLRPALLLVVPYVFALGFFLLVTD